MTDGLKVAKRLSEATLEMVDRSHHHGQFYLSEHARGHLGHENALDVLNRSDEDFIPFQVAEEGSLLLVQKQRIQLVHLHSREFDAMLAQARQEAGGMARVLLELAGIRLEGEAYTGDLHPDAKRVKDLLNRPRPFFLFHSAPFTYIVNKHQLTLAIPR